MNDSADASLRLARWRDTLETHQTLVYFAAVALGAAVALLWPGAVVLESAIDGVLALMLFATFLQVPLRELARALGRVRFLLALVLANAVLVPLLVATLLPWLPADPMLRLGVLLVLLAPCVDYVVTFAHLGRADARPLLAATPILLLMQMGLLPVQIHYLLGDAAQGLIQPGPFLHAFLILIVLPLLLAALVQHVASRHARGPRVLLTLGLLPVPATALVLLVVVAAVLPRLEAAITSVWLVLPIYGAFAVLAPLLGWLAARTLKLPAPEGRAVAFSAATRNSLVVLPLAFAVPGAVPLLPAIIVTQTLVELLASLVYIRVMPRLIRD